MHETIIANDIIKKAESKGKVKSAVIEVGDLAHLSAEELEETIKNMVKWTFVIVKKPAKVKCSCGYIGGPKIVEKRHGLTLFVCPECSSIPKVLEGKDIILKEVEVE